MITPAFIGIGSNLTGDRALTEVRRCISWLCQEFPRTAAAEPYVTEGEGVKSAGMTYINSVARIYTVKSADEVNAMLKDYEASRGRRHRVPEVTIDADLVTFGECILRPIDFLRSYFQRGYRQITKNES